MLCNCLLIPVAVTISKKSEALIFGLLGPKTAPAVCPVTHAALIASLSNRPSCVEVCCWPHEFSVLQSAVDAMGSTVTTPFCAFAACVFLSLTAPVSVHCAALGAPTQITPMKAKLAATTTVCYADAVWIKITSPAMF